MYKVKRFSKDILDSEYNIDPKPYYSVPGRIKDAAITGAIMGAGGASLGGMLGGKKNTKSKALIGGLIGSVYGVGNSLRRTSKKGVDTSNGLKAIENLENKYKDLIEKSKGKERKELIKSLNDELREYGLDHMVY
jgi:hypothetical protein